LLTEMRRDTQGEARPVLPQSFAELDVARLGARVIAHAVDPRVLPEEVGMRADFTGARALHAKILLAEGGGAALAYVGSANFTRRGWGFLHDPTRANIEAGLLLFREGRDAEALRSLLPAGIGDPIVLSDSKGMSLAPPDPMAEERPWPHFLLDVRLAPSSGDPDQLALTLALDPARVAGPWSVRLSDPTPRPLFDGGEGPRIVRHLDEDLLRDLLRAQEVDVHWWGSEMPCAFPLNVDLAARNDLPISPGDRPEEHLILAYYQGRITWEDLFPPPADWTDAGGEDDWEPPPPSRVDTSRIQSYQVREFVESLVGIRSDLKGASASESSMRLALSGPVSPVALGRQIIQAVREGRRSATAAGFEIVELISCLLGARDWQVSDGLQAVWLAEVDRALTELQRQREVLRGEHAEELGPRSSFARYEKVVCRESRVRSPS
jgi:hypothetical protein